LYLALSAFIYRVLFGFTIIASVFYP
jgi:hypothetical protein